MHYNFCRIHPGLRGDTNNGSRNYEPRLEFRGGDWIARMSGLPNKPLNQVAINILRVLLRNGELSVPAISRLLSLHEETVRDYCGELAKLEMISWNEATLLIEPKGRAYVLEQGHV
jgi:hypothetical protein